MSIEKTVRYQGRKKLKEYGFTKALIGLAMLAVFYMIIESVAYCELILLDVIKEDMHFLISVIYRSFTTLIVILLLPAVIGYIRMMFSEKGEYEMSDVTYYFMSADRYFKAVGLIFSYLLRMALPALICFSPVIAVVVINNLVSIEYFKAVLYSLIALSSIFLLIYSLKYFLTIKLFCDDEKQNMSFYFKTSKNIMQNHRWDVIRLVLSFTPWILLCITILPMLYVIPYITQSLCISAKWFYELSRDGR